MQLCQFAPSRVAGSIIYDPCASLAVGDQSKHALLQLSYLTLLAYSLLCSAAVDATQRLRLQEEFGVKAMEAAIQSLLAEMGECPSRTVCGRKVVLMCTNVWLRACVRVCVCVCVFESLFMHACPPKRFLHSDNHVYICVSPPPTSTHTRTYTYITHTHARTYTCSLTMHTHVHLTGLASNPDFKHPALPKLPTLLPGQAKAFTSLAFSYQVTER